MVATISDILARVWAGSEWTISDDDYSSLNWISVSTKPTESEIRSHSDAVDALISDEKQRLRQQRGMSDSPDYLLRVVETLIDGMVELRRVINDIRTTMVAGAHTGTFTSWDSNVVSRIAALQQKVTDLRNLS